MDTYTHGHGDAVLRSHRSRTVANSAAYVESHLVAGADVLDVGCGPGNLTAEIATRVTPGLVRGIDVAADIIEVVRAEHGEGANLEFAVDDVYDLSSPDGSFDLVHAHQLLQHLSDPVAALVEMGRVCRTGGVIAARDADYGAMRWSPANEVLDDWNALYRRVARSNRAEPDAGRHLARWADAAGFGDVAVTESTWVFDTAEEVRWWSELWAERSLTSGFAEQALERDMTDVETLEAIASAWRSFGSTPGARFEVPHGEVVCRVGGR